MKNKGLLWRLVWIALVIAGAVWVVQPRTKGNYFGALAKRIELVRGLDLAGGSHLVYELDLSKVDAKDRANSVTGVIQTIERRVNALGISEPTIQEGKIGDTRTVIVELPGLANTSEAINLIGKTAQLEFYEQPTNPADAQGSPVEGFVPTGLTGAHLKRADYEIQDKSQIGGSKGALQGEPVVTITFDAEGSQKFADLTRKNLQKPLAIVIDNKLISAPTVQSVIDQGNAVISGNFTIKDAKELSVALNSGALPVPITLVQQRTVGATLGTTSIEKSLVAGVIGILLVILFMVLYYGIRGVIASVALLIYTLIVAAVFKFIPVTITLAGIAGLILSIGAAVDANILIFERMKEEQRLGKAIHTSIDDGFRRAWSSIRDSNASSIITALILLWFGSGIVKGFAVTLLIGICASMFTAITVTQTLLKLFLRSKQVKSI